MLKMLLVILAMPVAAHPPLLLNTHEMPPYSRQIDGAISGLAVSRLDCALRAMNQPYRLQLLPWKRAQHEVASGRADGFFAAARNPQRDRYALASVVIAPQVWTWFQRRDARQHPTDLDFRRNAVVASFLGAAMYEHLKEQGYPNLRQARDMDELIDWLASGTVDAVMAADLVMAKKLEQRGLSEEMRAIPYLDKPLVAYFAKSLVAARPTFMTTFNDAVTRCINAETAP